MRQLNNKQKAALFHELHLFFEAGLDLKNALALLIQETKDKKQKSVYLSINNAVLNGSTLAEALKASGLFVPYEIYSLSMGEATGNLALSTSKLSQFYNRKIKLRSQLVGALTYPMFILILTVGVLFFMLSVVVPMFADIFDRFDSELPAITLYVLQASEYFKAYGMYFLILGIISGIALKQALKKDQVKFWLAKAYIKVPIYGALIKQIETNKFYQSMSMMLQSHVTMLEAIKMSKEIVTFLPLKYGLNQVETDLFNGVELNRSLSTIDFFPDKDLLLIKIGEELNQLYNVFDQLTVQYQDSIDQKSAISAKMIEPVLIVIVGGLVGFILVAMYLPLFQLSTSI